MIDRSQFSEYDASGFPTKMADGSDVPKARVKKLKKDWDAQKKQHEKFLEKAGGNPDAFLATLRERVAELQAATKQ